MWESHCVVAVMEQATITDTVVSALSVAHRVYYIQTIAVLAVFSRKPTLVPSLPLFFTQIVVFLVSVVRKEHMVAEVQFQD